MKFLDKIKNIIAPELDDDIIEEHDSEEISKMDKLGDSTAEEIGDNQEYKNDETFDFPVVFDEAEIFDEYEAPTTPESPKIPAKEITPIPPPPKPISEPTPIAEIKSEIERPKITSHREVKMEPLTKKPFKPSPIISPVYGIIGEQPKVATKVDTSRIDIKEEPVSKITFDSVRQKAYGSVEDELEQVINDGTDIFFNLVEEEEPEPIIDDNIISDFVEEQKDISELTISEAEDTFEYRGVPMDSKKSTETRAERNKDVKAKEKPKATKSKTTTKKTAKPKTTKKESEIDQVLDLVDEMYQEKENS